MVILGTPLHRICEFVASLFAKITLILIERLFQTFQEEVQKELPQDAQRFKDIDEQFKIILKEAGSTRNVMGACNADGLLLELEGLQTQLEMCKKSLADFLDGKRRQFPRFYFVSESDLLDILSNGSRPSKIVRHITKVLLATKTLILEGDEDDDENKRPSAVSFVAAVGVEEVAFDPAVPLEGKVEMYLQTVLDAMKTTVSCNGLLLSAQHGIISQQLINKCFQLLFKFKSSLARYSQQPRIKWLMHRLKGDSKVADGNLGIQRALQYPVDPSQVALLVSAIKYVSEVEDAFQRLKAGTQDAMKDYNVRQLTQLAELIKLTRTQLSKCERKRIMCMITMDAHNRDVVRKFVRDGVSTEDAFQWQSQLRATAQNDQPHLKICDASFRYGFEYLGNGSRLVITPLTDRIYVTATQALHLKMGCAPAGPAG